MKKGIPRFTAPDGPGVRCKKCGRPEDDCICPCDVCGVERVNCICDMEDEQRHRDSLAAARELERDNRWGVYGEHA